MDNHSTGRRQFLKGSLALGTFAAGSPVLAQSTDDAAKAAPPSSPTATLAHAETAPVAIDPAGGKANGTSGSDYMVDLLAGVGIRYVAAIPGSTFRGLHESIVSYGHNTPPELTPVADPAAIGLVADMLLARTGR